MVIESVNPMWTDLSRDWYEYEPADYERSIESKHRSKRRSFRFASGWQFIWQAKVAF